MNIEKLIESISEEGEYGGNDVITLLRSAYLAGFDAGGQIITRK